MHAEKDHRQAAEETMDVHHPSRRETAEQPGRELEPTEHRERGQRPRQAAPAARLRSGRALPRRRRAIALDPREVDLGELASTCAERLWPQFEDKQVTLTVQPGPPLLLASDPDRITQVLTKLLGNALTYTPTGGSVVVVPSRTGDEAEVAIVDDGIGLAPDDLAAVFDRFYRAQGPTRPTGGVGSA